jgi:hypothetical protein
MSISSYLVLRSWAKSRPERAPVTEPPWRRWYAPWLAAALALVCLIGGAIATLEVLTVTTSQSSRLPPRPDHQDHADDHAIGVELIGRQH